MGKKKEDKDLAARNALESFEMALEKDRKSVV